MSGDELQLSDEAIEQVKNFLVYNDPLRASRNLRRMFFDYLRFQEGLTATHINEMIDDVEVVIELMEVLANDKES